MVVDDIEDDCETIGVQRVNQGFESVGPAISMVRGIQIDSIVTPSPITREFRDGHQLHMSDSQALEVRNSFDGRGECALPSECPYVQFVHNSRREGTRLP